MEGVIKKIYKWWKGGKRVGEWGEGVVEWVCIEEMDLQVLEMRKRKNTFKVFLQSFV